ncbi:MAG: NAD(P)-binding domain-containing protein [Bacteroidota bacterium]|nr:NAD(P)-binding domain-containing protein [Bacteroidota bacterium]
MNIDKKHWNTIVIGGGQAGLSAGYYLKKSNNDFLILDGSARIGDSWRERWDSLKLFTPTPFNALPGWPYPGEDSLMQKDQMADYLEQYAKKFSLPVRSGIRVTRLTKSFRGFFIESSRGSFTCDRVIVATGTHQVPHIPEFSSQLDPEIVQLHSSDYRNPGTLPPGDVLVVGSATSGIEIALEVSQSRRTMIAGKPSFIIPAAFFRFGLRFYWWLINNLLTIKTPVGRKAMPNVIKGGAVIPQIVKKLENARVTRIPRVVGVRNYRPVLEDGRIVPVSTIIWCTGFRPDFSWIHINNITSETGWPVTNRGISSVVEGMYFVGIPFQFGLTSGLVGGVGRDAAYIVKHILKNSGVREIE